MESISHPFPAWPTQQPSQAQGFLDTGFGLLLSLCPQTILVVGSFLLLYFPQPLNSSSTWRAQQSCSCFW